MAKKKEQVLEQVPEVEPQKEETTIALTEHDHKMLDNDIKYRGPLSYRYLRLIGWVAMAIMFIGMILGAAYNVKTSNASTEVIESLSGLSMASYVLSYFSSLPLPLFLIANFAIIMQSKKNYKKLIFKYLKLVIIIYIAFIIVYYHYIVIAMMRLGGISFVDARQTSIEIFTLLGKQSGLVVNVFVDLLCCALIMFFIDYTPKKYFQGKKIIIFRLLVLLPLLYEIGSATLMGLMGLNNNSFEFTFSLPPEILPLIGKKPIGMIIGFLFICIYVKIREKIYLKRGGTKEGYEQYVQTNRNSFRFSLLMAVVFFFIAIIDLLIVLIPLLVEASNGADEYVLEILLTRFTGFTLGKSVCLLLVIPFILLFSYTKKHANEKPDKLLPIAGVGIVLFAIIETAFFAFLF